MTERKVSPWIAYMSSQMKGKKFKNRAEVNAYVKKLSQEFKASKK